MYSYAVQHGPVWLSMLHQDGKIACTFSVDGLTIAFVFDPTIACLEQHLCIQCSTMNGPTTPGTIAANIGGTLYGVSSHISLGAGSWKKRSDEGTLRR
jgi:hypothetical protein